MYWFTLTSLLHKNIAQRRFVKCFCSDKCKIGGLNTDLNGKSKIKVGTSKTSFCDAVNETGVTSIYATLDKIHREITNTQNGFHNTTNAGPVYGIVLQKYDSSGQAYSGIAFGYATMAIVYFAYVGGTFYIKVYG